MRILLVSDYYPPVLGGIATIVRSLAYALHSRGHEVRVCAVAGPRERTVEQEIVIYKSKNLVSFFPFILKQVEEPTIPPMPDPIFIRDLQQICSEFKPDIIHTHGWVMFPTSFYRRTDRTLRVVATLHDYGFFCAKRDLIPEFYKESRPMVCPLEDVGKECLACSSRIYGFPKAFGIVSCIRLFKSLLSEVNSITAVSNYVREKAQNTFKTRFQVVPNFIDPEKFISMHRHAHAKHNGPVDILFVGRLTPAKGIGLLTAAFKILHKSLPEAKLVIVGKKDPFYNIRIKEESVLQYEGINNEDLVSLYNQARIVVVPSIWADPAPLVALEAMAFGKPLVVTNVGGLKEIVVHGKTGLVVEPSPENLATAIELLLSNASESSEMGARGKLRLLDNYTSERTIPKFEQIYEQALA